MLNMSCDDYTELPINIKHCMPCKMNIPANLLSIGSLVLEKGIKQLSHECILFL
jgi:hypothetical protein